MVPPAAASGSPNRKRRVSKLDIQEPMFPAKGSKRFVKLRSGAPMHLKVPFLNWPADDQKTLEYIESFDNGSPTQALFVISEVSESIQNSLLHWLK